MKRKKMSDEQRTQRELARRNIERLRKLAERAQADLDRRKRERESA